MTRIARRIPVAAVIWRRDNPFDYFHQVVDALRTAGVPVDFAHYDVDKRDRIDAWIQVGDRDITWSPDSLWLRGWHLSPAGGRLADGARRRLHEDTHPDPAAVVAAARAHLAPTPKEPLMNPYVDWCTGCHLDVTPDGVGCECPPGPEMPTTTEET